jgi:hypothetical protein
MAIDRGGKAAEPDPEELIEELQQKLERLRALYEMYFMGIERVEPQIPRKEVTRKLQDLSQLHIRNTALRYRFNMLNQKFGVYQTYWNRTTREIEKGTYFRDVARLGRLAAAKGEDVPEEVLRALPERLRARVMKDRATIQARRKRESQPGDELTPAPLPPELAGGKKGGLPERKGGGSWLDADDNDIDAALDNLFGEAEAAVGPKVSTPVPAPTPSTPIPVAVGKPKVSSSPPTPLPRGASVPPPLSVPRPATPVPRAAASSPSLEPRVATGTPRPAPPLARGSAPLPAGVDERTARELHQRFVSAKRSLGEPTDHIKLEHIAQTIAKQTPAIMQQHGAKAVDFQVVVKDGKAILKAVPKK